MQDDAVSAAMVMVQQEADPAIAQQANAIEHDHRPG
jgi:hypothetical protein